MPGPSKVPPVIGTIRRRPCATSPTSSGGPTVARNSKASVRRGAGLCSGRVHTGRQAASKQDGVVLDHGPLS